MPRTVERFECRFKPSRVLLWFYSVLLLLALLALYLSQLPGWAQLVMALLAISHAVRVLPRQILLSHPAAITALRYDADGLSLFSDKNGWQPVRLCPDTLALPLVVVLRFRMHGWWFSRGICIFFDALDDDTHRRLRVRLKFAPRRFADK